MINCFSFNLLSSTLGTTDNGRNFPRINTSPVEILSADILEPPSSQVKLEISKTEKHRNNNILAEEAAQIFDDKIPVQQKEISSLANLQQLFLAGNKLSDKDVFLLL